MKTLLTTAFILSVSTSAFADVTIWGDDVRPVIDQTVGFQPEIGSAQDNLLSSLYAGDDARPAFNSTLGSQPEIGSASSSAMDSVFGSHSSHQSFYITMPAED